MGLGTQDSLEEAEEFVADNGLTIEDGAVIVPEARVLAEYGSPIVEPTPWVMGALERLAP